MARTYSVEPCGQFWRIRSNGKPLAWLYPERRIAEWEIARLQEKAAARAERRSWLASAGIAPRKRDSKRKAVYRAERVAGVIGNPLCRLTKLTTEDMVNECERWAREAGLPALRPRVRISNRKRQGWAHASFNEIVLSPGLCIGVLVHEYAHVLTWEEQPAHGPKWANTYVQLVRVAMGDSFANELARQFRMIGFKIFTNDREEQAA